MTFRRDFLAFTAGAVAARTVLPAVVEPVPPRPSLMMSLKAADADLLATIDEWGRAHREFDRLSAEWDRTDNIDVGRATVEAALTEERLLAQICRTMAFSMAGMQAKAIALCRYMPERLTPGHNPQDNLTISLMRDLMIERGWRDEA